MKPVFESSSRSIVQGSDILIISVGTCLKTSWFSDTTLACSRYVALICKHLYPFMDSVCLLNLWLLPWNYAPFHLVQGDHN